MCSTATGDSVVATVKIQSNPYALAVNEGSNKVYVANTYSNTVTVIDGATNAVTDLKVGSADALVVDSKRNVITCWATKTQISEFWMALPEPSAKFGWENHLWGMAIDESREVLYLTRSGNAEVIALDEKTHELNAVPTGTIPCAVAVNPVTQTAYVVNYGDETVTAIDAAKHKVLASLHVGQHPQAIAVDSVHNRIYVANVHSNSITAIDGIKNAVIGQYDAGKNPYALAVDPSVSADLCRELRRAHVHCRRRDEAEALMLRRSSK